MDANDNTMTTGPADKHAPITSGIRVVAFIAAFGVALAGGPLAALAAGGEKKGGHEGGDGAGPAMSKDPPFFFELPSMLINLNSSTSRPVFLKVQVTVEVGAPEDVHTMTEVMPMVLDAMQLYLRGKKAEDLTGSVGMYRLRRDLMARIAAPSFPAKIKDVLFKELLVQ